ncbi:MAG TPA: aminodeoxychorismate synthase component I [Saprospiraceae bacterium]|nr:aminodeoxychorismate synthase component I [Saprospiraceae bacterium]
MHPVFAKMNQLGRDNVPFLFILDYALKRPVVLPLSEVNPADIQYAIGRWDNLLHGRIDSSPLDFSFKPPGEQIFKEAFQQIQAEIHAGNTYLANLCFRIPIQINWSLDTIFAQAEAPYKLRYKNEFVFFSPETFVKIKQGQIATFPMKGTIDAAIPDARNVLLNDPKEDAEHATIVDLLRNDLSAVAKKVRLERYKYLNLVENNRGALWQMSSKITGDLPSDYPENIGTILRQLLPAGSITGAPKKKTTEIIDAVERHKRGFYTGIAGIFDNGQMDSAVMIRFLEKEGDSFFYRSGGGITSQSAWEKEYAELLKKVYIPVQPKNLLLETIRWEKGQFMHLGWHQQRFDESRTQIFGEKIPPISLEKLLYSSVQNYDFGEQTMKCRVLYDKKVERVEYHPYRPKAIHSLQCVYITQHPGSYKWEDRRFYMDLLAQKGDADEILIICDGRVTDISYANVALCDGVHWWTPALPILKGTSMRRLIDEGILKTKEIPVEELSTYQKLRIFNAMIPWEKAVEVKIEHIKI